MNCGAFNRKRYDKCYVQKDIFQSMSPLEYWTYRGMYENVDRCKPFKTYEQVVDVESDLRNITRPISYCDQFKYNYGCPSKNCISTFNGPVVMEPTVCPFLKSNMFRKDRSGFQTIFPHVC